MMARFPPVLIFLLLAAGCVEDAAPESLPPPSAQADYSLDVAQWHAEFVNDVQAAVKKYDGKVVELSGTVQFVSQDPQDQVGFVYLAVAGSELGDRCSTIDKKPWLRVSPGSKVTLRGKAPAYGLPGDFVEAEIVSASPNPAVSISAEQLAKECIADPKAATDKYDEKWANLEGEVVEKTSTAGVVQLKLKGDVTCSFNERVKRSVENIKVGAQVKLFGQLSIERQPSVNGCVLTEAK